MKIIKNSHNLFVCFGSGHVSKSANGACSKRIRKLRCMLKSLMMLSGQTLSLSLISLYICRLTIYRISWKSLYFARNKSLDSMKQYKMVEQGALFLYVVTSI